MERNNWEELIENWRYERDLIEIEGLKRKTSIDQFIFYYEDGKSFLKIYDRRDSSNVYIYNLDELEREVFLSCIDVVSLDQLKEKLTGVSEEHLLDILRSFEDFLALPLSYSLVNSSLSRKETQHDQIVFNY